MPEFPRSCSRRDFLRAGAAVACVGPFVRTRRKKTRLRVLGTHVTLQEVIRKQAEVDLGIEIEFQPGGSAAVLQQASTRPHTFDVFEQWSNTIPVLWQAEAIQPIDIDRIREWKQINDLTKSGRLTSDAKIGRGDAPHRMLYVQPDGGIGSHSSKQISFLPYVHNVDSFGYATSRRIDRSGSPYETESWGWLLDRAPLARPGRAWSMLRRSASSTLALAAEAQRPHAASRTSEP